MTVGELIALLNAFPPELPIFVTADHAGRIAGEPKIGGHVP